MICRNIVQICGENPPNNQSQFYYKWKLYFKYRHVEGKHKKEKVGGPSVFSLDSTEWSIWWKESWRMQINCFPEAFLLRQESLFLVTNHVWIIPSADWLVDSHNLIKLSLRLTLWYNYLPAKKKKCSEWAKSYLFSLQNPLVKESVVLQVPISDSLCLDCKMFLAFN